MMMKGQARGKCHNTALPYFNKFPGWAEKTHDPRLKFTPPPHTHTHTKKKCSAWWTAFTRSDDSCSNVKL